MSMENELFLAKRAPTVKKTTSTSVITIALDRHQNKRQWSTLNQQIHKEIWNRCGATADITLGNLQLLKWRLKLRSVRYSGIFACFFCGLLRRLLASKSKSRHILARVTRGSMMSST